MTMRGPRRVSGVSGGRAVASAFALRRVAIPFPAFHNQVRHVMPDQPQKDAYREKFRPDADAALDREVEAALGGMSIESLMEADEPPKPAGGAPQQRGGGGGRRGPRTGRIISVQTDHAFVDLGGKDQGIVPMQQFEQEPVVG